MARKAELRDQLSAEMQRYIAASVRHQVAIAHQLGMPVSDVHALTALLEFGPFGVSRLADVMGMTTGAATRLADRLERDGYVRREPDAADRRRVVLHVVPERMSEVARHYQPMDARWERQIGKYTEAELRLLLKFLTEGRASAQEETTALRSGGRSHATRRRSQPDGGEHPQGESG